MASDLFVTGASGLVGSHVARQAHRRGLEVIAAQIPPEPSWDLDIAHVSLDLNDRDAVSAAIDSYRPRWVIHCAALLDQTALNRQRAAAWHFMVDGTMALARACRAAGSRLVFVSSDWVFDGRQPLVDEQSPPFPTTFYGVLKMAAEQRLLTLEGLDVAIGRLAGVYGLNLALPEHTRWQQGIGAGDLVNAYVRQIRSGGPIEVWHGEVNEASHPTLADDGADLLLTLAASGLGGIFHTCGSESIDRLELARRCAEVFGGDGERIEQISVPDEVAAAHAEIRPPRRLVMAVEASAAALGRSGLGVNEGLQAFREQLAGIRIP